MKDLTTGSIPRHIVAMAIPTAAGMLLQTLYYFVDLYFVAKLGDAALAGVSAAGTTFLHWFIPGLALRGSDDVNVFLSQAATFGRQCAGSKPT